MIKMGMGNKNLINRGRINVKFFHVGKQYGAVCSGIKKDCWGIFYFNQTRESPISLQALFVSIIVIEYCNLHLFLRFYQGSLCSAPCYGFMVKPSKNVYAIVGFIYPKFVSPSSTLTGK